VAIATRWVTRRRQKSRELGANRSRASGGAD
jgi:hypothetical protein